MRRPLSPLPRDYARRPGQPLAPWERALIAASPLLAVALALYLLEMVARALAAWPTP